MTRQASRGGGEEGAYLVLYAVLATGLLAMAALVLDFAALRQDRGADRATADLAVAAAGLELNESDPATRAIACQQAWDYALANRGDDAGAVTQDPACAATFTLPCVPGIPVTATGVVGNYTVEITSPVVDGSALMKAETLGGDQSQASVPGTDGTPCQRIGVRLVHTRAYAFGTIIGSSTGRTDVHGVARGIESFAPAVPTIVALEPSGCSALEARNNRSLTVGTAAAPGVVVVDSTAGPPACTWAMNADGAAQIRADTVGGGFITSYALTVGNLPGAYDPGDIPGRITPTPLPAAGRLGRGFIDRRYNCNGAGCAAGANHIDLLRAALTGPGNPGFVDAAAPCTIPALGVFVLAAGDWFVNCPTFVVQAGGRASFLGGRVVFAGGVTVESLGTLEIGTAGADSIMFMQQGDFVRRARGAFALQRAFAYLHNAAGGGHLNFEPDLLGPNGSWTAPTGGDFEDLMLWTEAGGTSSLRDNLASGQGTIFAPNAALEVEDALDRVQLVARTVAAVGAEDAAFTARPDRATGYPIRAVRLVR